MKRLAFLFVAVATLAVTSCSKDAKINRRLDGSWNVVSYDGKALASGETETYTFIKTDKKEGTGTIDASGSGFTFSLPFTYKIEDQKMTITTTFFGSSDSEVITVTKYEKDHMELTESDGTVTVLEPK